MIPQETKDLILNTARIEEVVGDFVTLKRAGSSFVACCPFHNEKTPSFHVTPSRGIYKCFGCGKGGSAVNFVMEMEHCSYPEALRYLARKYNITIQEKEETAEDIANRQHRESLMIVMDFAQNFFVQQLSQGEGKNLGYAYLKGRALEDETIRDFGLGWAPSGKSSLIDAALAAGHKIEYLIETGLAVQYDDGSFADKFRARVMFPIHSVSGRVIAFTGRTLRSDVGAKYMNSSETPLYHKSDNLLGIYFAKNEMGRLHNCILVEGNVDMVMLHQLGLKNVVASCGTALTQGQVELIKRFALDNITIMYDGDSAGVKAALKGINLFLAEDLNVKVVFLPDGDDPDSYARKHTLDEFRQFIAENSQDFIEFICNVHLKESERDPIKRADLINEIADTIAFIPDPVKRAVYIDVCAQKFNKDESLILSRVNKTIKTRLIERKKAEDRTFAPSDQEEIHRIDAPENKVDYVVDSILDPAEKDLLYFLFTHGQDALKFQSDSVFYQEGIEPYVADLIKGTMDDDNSVFRNPLYRRAYDLYFEKYASGVPQDEIIRSFLNGEDRELSSLAFNLVNERYELTIQAFKDSMTSVDSWLVTYVPKAIINYIECGIKSRIDICLKQMNGLSSDEQMDKMEEMVSLQNTLKEFKKNYE